MTVEVPEFVADVWAITKSGAQSATKDNVVIGCIVILVWSQFKKNTR